jgi:hypothetical protein
MPEHFRVGIGGDPEMTATGLMQLNNALDEYEKSEADRSACSQPISRTSPGTFLQFGPAFNDLQQEQEQRLALRVQEDQMFAVNLCGGCDQYVSTRLRRANADAVTLVCHLRHHLAVWLKAACKQVKKKGSPATGRLCK